MSRHDGSKQRLRASTASHEPSVLSGTVCRDEHLIAGSSGSKQSRSNRLFGTVIGQEDRASSRKDNRSSCIKRFTSRSLTKESARRRDPGASDEFLGEAADVEYSSPPAGGR